MNIGKRSRVTFFGPQTLTSGIFVAPCISFESLKLGLIGFSLIKSVTPLLKYSISTQVPPSYTCGTDLAKVHDCKYYFVCLLSFEKAYVIRVFFKVNISTPHLEYSFHQNRGVRPPRGPHTTVHATKWPRESVHRIPSRIG